MRYSLFFLVVAALWNGTASGQDLSRDTAKTDIVDTLVELEDEPGEEIVDAAQLYESGATRQRIGRIMSWAGLGMVFFDAFAESGGIAGLGILGIAIGIPVNGSGASDMVEASNAMNPAAEQEMGGWGTYTASLALMASGVGLLVKGVTANVQATATSDRKYSNNNTDNMIAAGLFGMLSGASLQFVSWYQFSNAADLATQSRYPQPISLEFAPAVYASRTNGVMPGMQVALRF
ncbi:MAG: hypothetical protein RL173_237 [Fibrobacterota bacterium]|jgi:hypothetical protein